MPGRRPLMAALTMLLMALSFGSPTQLRAQEQGRFVDLGSVATATQIAPPKIVVWLPPGYDSSKRRYGVIYMHDGQNLFDPKRSNFNKVWAADKSALRLIASRQVAPFIIVGIDQPGADRGRQYFPRPMLEHVSPATRQKLEAQGNGKPMIAEDYLRFIVTELKPQIDRMFRTKSGRKYTAIAGSSMGGLISLYAITKYPEVFGTAGAVSTHLPLGDPNWSESERQDIISAWHKYVKLNLGKPDGRRIWFDHGTETLDAFYQPYQDALDAALVAHKWKKGRDFKSTTYPGTPHEENAWAARLDDIFGWMLRDF
ncbi:alpha/beta hydrolase [Sphingorhabdus sp.]|uniref:alpha/beta hydrolase n=1 Tax=Sphingorhabdus sp. TaxID=1902408 RepID=UPI0039832EF4